MIYRKDGKYQHCNEKKNRKCHDLKKEVERGQ